MEKNILKVDPIALGYYDIKLEKDDFNEENDFEWDQKDLQGGTIDKIFNKSREKEINLDGFLEDDDI